MWILKALRDFGLQRNFRGIVFRGISAHWLDNGFMGANIVRLETRPAVSFHEAVSAGTPARLYAAIHAEIDPSNRGSYLKLLKKGADFKLSLAGSKVRNCSIAVEFADIKDNTNPYAWLSSRKANISLTSITVIDAGAPREEYGVDISFVVSDKSALGRFTKDDLSLSQKSFNYLASVPTLSPVFKLASGRISAPPNADDKRVSFVEVGAGSILGGLFATAALGTS